LIETNALPLHQTANTVIYSLTGSTGDEHPACAPSAHDTLYINNDDDEQ